MPAAFRCFHFLFLSAAVSLAPVQRAGWCILVLSTSRARPSPTSLFVTLGRAATLFTGVHHFFLFFIASLVQRITPHPTGSSFPQLIIQEIMLTHLLHLTHLKRLSMYTVREVEVEIGWIACVALKFYLYVKKWQ